jgi:hypothetical protein
VWQEAGALSRVCADLREHVQVLEQQLEEASAREERLLVEGAEEMMDATLEVARLQELALELEEEVRLLTYMHTDTYTRTTHARTHTHTHKRRSGRMRRTWSGRQKHLRS